MNIKKQEMRTLPEEKWEKGKMVLKILQFLDNSIGKKTYFGFNDHGLFTEKKINVLAVSIKIAREIHDIIEKTDGVFDDNTIKKAVKTWFIQSGKNGKLFKLMPEYFLEKTLPEKFVIAVRAIVKIYNNAIDKQIPIARAFISWYAETKSNGKLPKSLLGEYFEDLFSEEITDLLSKIGNRQSQKELATENLVFCKLEKIISERHLVAELLVKNKDLILEAKKVCTPTAIKDFLNIPNYTFRLFEKNCKKKKVKGD